MLTLGSVSFCCSVHTTTHLFSHGKNEDFRHDYPSNPSSISVYKTLAISQHLFHCMTTYKSTAITTDRKDSDSSVKRERSYPSRHALFSVTQSKLPRPIRYDRKCGRLTTRFQPCSIIYGSIHSFVLLRWAKNFNIKG